MNKTTLDFCTRLADGLSMHFGTSCEIVIHDLQAEDLSRTIVYIKNGHVTNRQIGDGPLKSIMEILNSREQKHEDQLACIIRSADGRTLKSTAIFVNDENEKPVGMICINYDISLLLAAGAAIQDFTFQNQSLPEKPETAPTNINALLESLIEQSIQLIGKPAALMRKDEKMRAIRFLNDSGAFLITKSGPKVCARFGISKYTLYSYLDQIKQ